MDRHYFEVEIVAGENKLVFFDDDDASSKEATITPGIYFTHRDATLNSAGYKSLYLALETAINAVLASGVGTPPTWIFQAITPPGSGLTGGGLSIVRSTFTAFMSIDPSSTLDLRLLGGFGNVFGMDYDGDDTIIAPAAVLGRWQSFNLLDNEATDRRTDLSYESYHSTEEILESTRSVRTNTRRAVRSLVYEYVPPLHVRAGSIRAQGQDYLATAELVAGDSNNAFEHFWDAASAGGDILTRYDDPGDTNMTIAAGRSEIAVMASPEQRARLSACLEMMRAAGEMYRVKLDLLIKTSNFGY